MEKRAKTIKKKSAPRTPKKSSPSGKSTKAKIVSRKEEIQIRRKKEYTFPIVGLGSSAGGLEAFKKFLEKMPPDSGMAFVSIMHLASDKKSFLSELIKKYTQMKVLQIKDKMEIRSNYVYITPPNKEIAIFNGLFHLMEPTKYCGIKLPIDYFFRSLAEDQGENAVCIILSGTGSDGTLGLKAVKERGGLAIVQEPESAVYDGMPRSAISTGLVDLILKAEEMPKQLTRYAKHSFIKREKKLVILPKIEDHLEKIFILLRNKTKHDFSHYKKSTILRRIEKRMAIHHINDVSLYVRYLQQNYNELTKLFKGLLIGVTNFFREPEAFEILKEKIFPELLKDKSIAQPCRAWVPGCSTGEEVYSIAIILQEYIKENDLNNEVQIFATDIDEDAINKARTGIFPLGISADVSPDRLKEYFVKKDNTYLIKKDIREKVIFSVHNVIDDPPFPNIDLLSCRNVLIYLDSEIQTKVLTQFHYSLNKDGILLLGSSETIGYSVDLFKIVNKKWKIYKRKGITSFPLEKIGILPSQKKSLPSHLTINQIDEKRNIGIDSFVDNLLLKDYSPACVLIDDNYEILFIHGRTGNYLEPASGKPRMNIMEMARESLNHHLMNAIHSAKREKREIVESDIKIKHDGDYYVINLIVRPIFEPEPLKGHMLVLFEDKTASSKKEQVFQAENPKKQSVMRIKNLENELRATKDYLSTTTEELDASNQELRSMNEEFQSTNEELQSSNEELETSREELQSVNEELLTINSEYQIKIDELSKAYNDSKNLLSSTEIAVLFLDAEMRIKRFTPQSKNIINLIESDINRPIDQIVTNVPNFNISEAAQQVLTTSLSFEKEVFAKSGDIYKVNILPYRTTENVIEGIVITFSDITDIKKQNENIRRFSTVLYDSNDAITLQDFKGNILDWNRGAELMYGYKKKEAIKMKIQDLIPNEKREEEEHAIKKLSEGGKIKSFITKRVSKDGKKIFVWLTFSVLKDESEKPYAFCTTERDITERLKIEAELKKQIAELKRKTEEQKKRQERHGAK